MTAVSGSAHHGPPPTKTVTRFVKCDAARFFTTFLKTLVVIYLLSIPLTWYEIQTSGMGMKFDDVSIPSIFFAIVMISFLWAPLTCMMGAPILLPMAAVIAFVAASIRRVAIVADARIHL